MTPMDQGKFRHRTQLRVRIHEIDWQGVVHNAHVLLYFEVGRAAYLKDLGIGLDATSVRQDMRVVVVRNEVDYRSPARFDELLDVYTRVSFIRNSSFAFEAVIRNEETSRVVAENVSIHVWLDAGAGRPMRVPDDFRRIVGSFEGKIPVIS